MSKIQKFREFIQSCPLMDDFAEIHIDWTDANAGSIGIMPTGESIVGRIQDVCGNVTLRKQYNVSIYAMEFTIDDVVRLETSGWLEDFTEWIEEQSAKHTIPVFGDNPDVEYMTAQNGMLFYISDNNRTGRYQIQIQCFYEKHYQAKEQDILWQ
ncbi:MAG: hypothetical protein K1V97_00010 [Lachnospiraceae bacterium]